MNETIVAQVVEELEPAELYNRPTMKSWGRFRFLAIPQVGDSVQVDDVEENSIFVGTVLRIAHLGSLEGLERDLYAWERAQPEIIIVVK